jgi:UDP-N-acetylmuramate: L-alanyl-gamma-D-glutamyl-meso-diaminopimelate ligase
VVLNGDDPSLRALGPMPWTRVVRVGVDESNDVRIAGFTETPAGANFRLLWHGEEWGHVRWSLAGLYNARNAAMAATAAGLALDATSPAVLSLEPLARFRGVKRRQEVLFSDERVTVIEDFGHHPTALVETLQSFRARFPDTLLIAVFEPRSNTARTKAMQVAFMRALSQADEVYLGAVNRPDKIAPEERFDPEAVAQHLETQGIEAHFADSNAALLEKLVANTRWTPAGRAGGAAGKPRVIAFFTNGSFDGIIAKYVTAVRDAAAAI